MQLFIYYFSFLSLNLVVSTRLLIQHRYSNLPKKTSYIYAQSLSLQNLKSTSFTFVENIFILFFFDIKSNNNPFSQYCYNRGLKFLFLRAYKRPLLNYLIFTLVTNSNSHHQVVLKNSNLINQFRRIFKLNNNYSLLQTNHPFSKLSNLNSICSAILLSAHVTSIKTRLNLTFSLTTFFKKLSLKKSFFTYAIQSAVNQLNLNSSSHNSYVVYFLLSNFNSQAYSYSKKNTLDNQRAVFFFVKNFGLIQKTLQKLTNFNITVNSEFLKKIQVLYSIRFKTDLSSTFLTKHSVNNQKILFLRKNRIFNKSRYSRNRQLYRTGVYWCFWFTIFLGVGIYFVFYRFTVNFGYHWWLTFLALTSFIFNRVVKYRLYNPSVLISNIIKNLIWLHLILKNTTLVIKTTQLMASAVLFFQLVVNKFKYFLFKVV